MTDTTITQNPTPAAPAPQSEISPELAYLQAHGEDISALQSELEGMFPSNRTEPAPSADPAPAPRRDVTADPNFNLGITRDGVEVKPAPTPAPAPVQPPAPQTPIERALDPLQPEGAKPDAADAEPGEVVIDAEGKMRDAKTGRFVPHQAFHAEREQRKAAEARAQKLNDDFIKAQERLTVLNEIIQGQDQLVKQVQTKPADPAPEPEKEIDPETDVFAAVKQVQKQNAERARQLAEIEKTANQRIDAIQQEARYRQDALQFALKNPDFPEAYKFFNDCRRTELQLLGYGDDSSIDQQIMREERMLMAQGFKMPGGPAQMIYKLAHNRGFRAKTPEPAPALAPVPQPVPEPTLPPAPAHVQSQQSVPQVAPDARAAVQRVQNGQQASTSLTGAGGSSGEGLTVQALADMSEDDFLQFAQKIGAKKLDRLLGWGG